MVSTYWATFLFGLFSAIGATVVTQARDEPSHLIRRQEDRVVVAVGPGGEVTLSGGPPPRPVDDAHSGSATSQQLSSSSQRSRADGRNHTAQAAVAASAAAAALAVDKAAKVAQEATVKEAERLRSLLGRSAVVLSQQLAEQDMRRLQLVAMGYLGTLFVAGVCSYIAAGYGDTQDARFIAERSTGKAKCRTKSVDAFLEAFAVAPNKVRMRLVGSRPEKTLVGRYVQRRTKEIVFNATMDLAPFVTPIIDVKGNGPISTYDLETVRRFVTSSNPLEVLVLEKEVEWDGWSVVAELIRKRLKELGFDGEVDVRLEAGEQVTVNQNHRWPRFIRSLATQAIASVSILGGPLWMLYVWTRTRKTTARVSFRVGVDPNFYWDLIRVSICAQHGFRLK